MSNGRLLQGKPFGISRDYPKEIIAARGRLWPEYKSLKFKYPDDKITIAFPAKLIWGGRVKRDEFPDWVSIMKGGSGDRDQPKLSMQAPDRCMPAPQPSAFQQAQTDLQPRPQQQQSSPGTPGPNHQAEPHHEARNSDTPETEPPNETSDDMVIDSEHSDQSDTEQPDNYSQAMERLRQTQERMVSRGMTKLTCTLQGTPMTQTPLKFRDSRGDFRTNTQSLSVPLIIKKNLHCIRKTYLLVLLTCVALNGVLYTQSSMTFCRIMTSFL